MVLCCPSREPGVVVPGSEVEDTEVVPADDLLLLAGLAPTVERGAGGGDPRPEGKVVALLEYARRGRSRG